MSDNQVKTLVEEGQKALAAVNEAVNEMKGSIDPLVEAKFAKANEALDAKLAKLDGIEADQKRDREAQQKFAETIEAALARIPVAQNGEGKGITETEQKHIQAFDRFIRKGDSGALDTFLAENRELKALASSDDTQAGYLLAPATMDAEVTRLVTEMSPVRQFADVVTIGSSMYEKTVNLATGSFSWEDDELDQPTEDTNPTYAKVKITPQAAAALYYAGPNLLDDAFVNVEAEMSREMAIAIAAGEGAAYVNGTGVGQPRGFLQYTKTLTGSYTGAWETVETHITGAAGAFKAAGSGPEEVFLDCIHSLKAPYQANARFAMKRQTLAEVRKIKDADGRPLFQWDGSAPATVAGEAYTIFQDMPTIADDAYCIAYGDFRAAYKVVDRAGLAILRDPYSRKPTVEFYGRKRVGGGVQNFEALKLIQFAD